MRVRAHNIRSRGPAPRFMQGALLGNGGLGAVVNTRPDAIVLRLGHNDVWDERIDESHARTVLDFAEVFGRVKDAAAGGRDPGESAWLSDYRRRMEEPYLRPYPRPYPCGQVVLGFERRRTRVLGHELDLATGICRVDLLHDGVELEAAIFVDQFDDVVQIAVTESAGGASARPFTRVRLLPDPSGHRDDSTASSAAELAVAYTVAGEIPLRDTVSEFELDGSTWGLSDELPARSSATADQHTLYLLATTPAVLSRGTHPSWYGGSAPEVPLERYAEDGVGVVTVALIHSRLPVASPGIEPGELPSWSRSLNRSVAQWKSYWARSSIALQNRDLERVWYRNTYFTQCAVRPGKRAPGLFGPWSSGEVGTAWHGDYHLNYNTQQLYWGVFSSNRVESHLPYVELVAELMPLSERWATDYFGLEGAYFPHSAYPLTMTTMPYPSPVWGWEISETPWAVQSLWWHYLFTQDEKMLADTLIAPLRSATRFMVAYLDREAALGSAHGDDRHHIFPTVVPEMYGLTPDLRLNRDCIADLTLTRFLFKAYIRAVSVLHADDPLAARASRLLDLMADYPTAHLPDGDVFVSVMGEDPDVVYNIPLAGMTVFPGEDHSWESAPEVQETAKRSIRRQRLEGGNELVFFHLQAARMGILDVSAFLAQLAYCELPNGTHTDMVLGVHGRYSDSTPFEFMSEMGVFVENFAVTAVINELLMQSSTGVIRVFPNDHGIGDASFRDLRAVGAFLVSAQSRSGTCEWIEIRSESGGELRLKIPWAECTISPPRETVEVDGGIVRIDMTPDETIRFSVGGHDSRRREL